MSTFTAGDHLSRVAGADLSAKIYYIVKTDSSGNIVLASAATDKSIGVLANEPISGETADVALRNGDGTFLVKLGGDVTKDAYLTSDGSGKAVVTTTTGHHVFGQVLAAGASGDVVEYLKKDFIHP